MEKMLWDYVMHEATQAIGNIGISQYVNYDSANFEVFLHVIMTVYLILQQKHHKFLFVTALQLFFTLWFMFLLRWFHY